MPSNPYYPLVELTRGPLVESIHFGALAVVDASGRLIASVGDPDLVANLRSSSKPFQSLPLIENGGVEQFGMSEREIAITCASHTGTDEHVAVLQELQAKINVQENDLLCGMHPPIDEATEKAMLLRGEPTRPYRHNCSGKHTGMLAQAVLTHATIEDYLNTRHPIQRTILQTFAEMLDMNVDDVLIGIDGCSAPTFAAPLSKAALGFARLADPSEMPSRRAEALRRIFHAMAAHPEMVSGPGQFDTRLMQVGAGKIVCKGGAEGYQAIGVLPGAAGPGSPALGITYKVIDGDQAGRARPVIGVSILRQLGVLSDAQAAELANFGQRPIYNWRKLEVGEIRPTFHFQPLLA